MTEARVLITDWRKEHNQVKRRSAKGYKPLALEAKNTVIMTP